MPFVYGKHPLQRTIRYLELGKVIFRENVKIFSVNYNLKGRHHEGAREFVFWKLPQIQYKNPNVQCITFTNLTPSPFIRIFFEEGKSVIIDIDSREKEDIMEHLESFTAVCKSPKEISELHEITTRTAEPSSFGYGCNRHCICEIFGQVPCPGVVMLPNAWKGLKSKEKFRIPPYLMEPGLEEEETTD